MQRFGGIATFMRLPSYSVLDALDVAIIGAPFDLGASNRPSARYGPRGIRSEPVLLRSYNMATMAAPFDSTNWCQSRLRDVVRAAGCRVSNLSSETHPTATAESQFGPVHNN
ncbi:MAG TPA: hypothetical protein DF783_08410 [Acidimicrobiaceae bacterium]|jgi:arginase family enzyme|nr:hypothetical protein [Acidimicrobiaceae bacterium]HCV36936.1 hypothetical protein [Acidimicrobiaceae bacterium]